MRGGGRTATTWTGSAWRHKETKAIRIPAVFADEIMAYAKALDNGNSHVQGNTRDEILKAIAAYIEFKKASRHPNQYGKELDTNTRAWDELRKFQKLVQERPEILGLPE
ncbi:MAG: hypothetical protein KME59_10830 [Trichormus sp. ATA11-4-KO1]|jgi:hypothetical protein|nr:hypothetical protein [Trichormus sp. ATA11-4-KO1]